MELESVKVLSAAICMGIGSIAPALAEGFIAGKAMEAMGRNPEVSKNMLTSMIIALAICETIAIYALVISFLILFAL